MKEYINKNNISVGVIGLLIGLLLSYSYYEIRESRYEKGYRGMRSYMKWGDKDNMMGINNMHRMGDGSMMMGGSMDMNSMMKNMMTMNMIGKSGKDLEKAFLTDMIPHHEGAVEMAKLLLQDKTTSPELVKFANDIITAQSKEIVMMKNWLNTKYK